eukprot:992189_1
MAKRCPELQSVEFLFPMNAPTMFRDAGVTRNLTMFFQAAHNLNTVTLKYVNLGGILSKSPNMFRNLPHLTDLDVATTGLTDTSCYLIAQSLPNLKHLGLLLNSLVTDAGVEYIVNGCQHLCSLGLAGTSVGRETCRLLA